MTARTRLSRQLCAAVTAALRGDRVKPPEVGLPLWNVFQRLNTTRTYHMAGPNPISFAEVEAYCRLMRLPLEPRHVEVLLAMDQVWLEHVYARARQPPEGVKAIPPVTKQPMSAALLDAMFQ